MKKNLLSVLILAVLIVDVVLTSVMLFSVTGAMKNTTRLVGKIATVLDIELATDQRDASVSIEDTVTYTLGETLTIPLKEQSVNDGGDGKIHYAVVKITLYMNKNHEDFEKYGTDEVLAERAQMIQNEVVSVIGSYTLDEFKNDSEGIYAEILTKLQKMYNSKFIYRVASGDSKYS